MKTIIEGNLVDIFAEKIYPARVSFQNGLIIDIECVENAFFDNFIMPGIVNSHVHIESSMLTPVEFSRLAVEKGTVAVVSDPHEIANVLGEKGILFMLENAKQSPMKFYFGVPSCVPATSFETAGATLNSDSVKALLDRNDMYFLSEMMNFPGVINNDEDVFSKINHALSLNKRIDGHAPGLSGANLKKYAAAGITTDHESSTAQEAEEKIKLGIKLQIREGSAAKNFDSLYSLIDQYPNDVMLCTDDSHPDDLIEGHIDLLLKRGVEKAVNIFNLIKSVSKNPVNHYKLNVGLLRIGDAADFIVVDNLNEFNVLETYIDGEKVYSHGNVFINKHISKEINNFKRTKLTLNSIRVFPETDNIRVIHAFDGELLTKEIICKAHIIDNNVVSDVENDVLKIVVVNRYDNVSIPAVGFIKGFGLKKGAIAGSIAHDSHNIIAVGTSDIEILNAINFVIANKGAIVAVDNYRNEFLPLNIAGIMSNEEGRLVADKYKNLNFFAKELGTPLHSPFMTLSFMALLVIPELKLGDKALFKINDYSEVNLFI